MPPKGHIDLDRVVQVAIKLADEHSFEAVTLASVAAELGIRIPSLYNYVPGLPGLRYQMVLWGARQLADKLRRAAVGKAGDRAVFAIANAYREFAHEHPGVYRATPRAASPDEPDLTAAAQEALEIVLAVLEPYGFSGDDALHAVRALRSVLHGFVDLEAIGAFGMPLQRDESFRRLIHMLIQGLNAQQNG